MQEPTRDNARSTQEEPEKLHNGYHRNSIVPYDFNSGDETDFSVGSINDPTVQSDLFDSEENDSEENIIPNLIEKRAYPGVGKVIPKLGKLIW